MSGVRRWRLLALAAATAGATVALATVADDDDEAQYAHDGDEGDVLEDVHGDSFRRDAWSLLFVDPILPRAAVWCHRPGLRLSYGFVSWGLSAEWGPSRANKLRPGPQAIHIRRPNVYRPARDTDSGANVYRAGPSALHIRCPNVYRPARDTGSGANVYRPGGALVLRLGNVTPQVGA